VPQPSAFEVAMATEKLKHHKSLSTDQIPAELIKIGGITVHSEIFKLFNTIWNKDELPQRWKESIIVSIYERGLKQIVVEAYHFCQVRAKCYPTSCCQG